MPTKYVICDTNCKYPALDKEETLSAIQQAIENGGVVVDPTEPFITKIKDQNTGAAVKLWIGTEAQFNAIETKEENTVYIYPTDFETNVSDLLGQLRADLTAAEKNIADILDGNKKVRHATNADYAKGILPVMLFSTYTALTANDFKKITLPTDTLIGKRLEVTYGDNTYSSIMYAQFTLTSNDGYSQAVFPSFRASDGQLIGKISFYIGADRPVNELCINCDRTDSTSTTGWHIRRIRYIPEGQV